MTLASTLGCPSHRADGRAPPRVSFGLTWLLIALPLLGAAVLLLGGRRTDRWGHLLGCGDRRRVVRRRRGPVHRDARPSRRTSARSRVTCTLDHGRRLPGRRRPAARPAVDGFVLLITGVGSLIHIYSVGYMEHDRDRRRFFAYLNLFVAAMLLLVLADNYLVLYVGWEGVGLASYLLIGFWQHKPSAAVAAKKAFVVNRVGDVGLSLAIMSMFVDVRHDGLRRRVRRRAEATPSGWLTAIGLHAAARRLRQVGAVPAAVLAAATRWRARPRCRRSSTPRRWSPPASTWSSGRTRSSTARRAAQTAVVDRRRDHAADRCDHRLRQGRHQEGAGRLDDEPDRLHDAGRRPRPGRLRVRDLPPAHARLLQGRPVPRRRLGHARHERRGRHAPLRRAARRRCRSPS